MPKPTTLIPWTRRDNPDYVSEEVCKDIRNGILVSINRYPGRFRLYPLAEAAALLLIHPSTLLRYLKQGRINAYDRGQGRGKGYVFSEHALMVLADELWPKFHNEIRTEEVEMTGWHSVPGVKGRFQLWDPKQGMMYVADAPGNGRSTKVSVYRFEKRAEIPMLLNDPKITGFLLKWVGLFNSKPDNENVSAADPKTQG